MQFLNNSSVLLKFFWFTAIPISLVFLIQITVIFAGLDIVDQSENYNSILNEDETAYHFFSIKSLIHFLFCFSWTGISLYGIVEQPLLLLVLSVVSGILFVLLFCLIIKKIQLSRIDHSFKIQHAVNQEAEVFLSIPEHKNGMGKIRVTLKGIDHELEAVTEHEKIEAGTLVKVEKIMGNILVVKGIRQ